MSGKQFTIIVVITFIVGMVWLISDIIFNTKASIPISEKLESSLQPINPTFNSRVLDIIEREVVDSSVAQSVTTTIVPQTPAPDAIVATESANPDL